MTTLLPLAEPASPNGGAPEHADPEGELLALVDRIIRLADGLGRSPTSRIEVGHVAREIRQTAELAARMVRRPVDVDVSDPPDTGLSRREVEVLALLARGRSTQEIADELYVSVHTVRNHIHRIFGKLEVHSRVQAVAVASRLGIVEVG